MEKLTAGQCSEFVNSALQRNPSAEVTLLAYVVDSLIQLCSEMSEQLAKNDTDMNSVYSQLQKLDTRYSELQYLAKVRDKNA